MPKTLLESRLQEKLLLRQKNHLYRHRKVLESVQAEKVQYADNPHINQINFCSNNYLNLNAHPEIIRAFKKGLEQYGAGAGASYIVTGYTSAQKALEEKFADFLERPRALFFSNGYAANLGTLQALMNKEDIIYQDKLNHASLIDGALLSKAKLKRYSHRDTDSLESLIKKDSQQNRLKLIITESIFSMDGAIAPVKNLVNIAKENHAALMIDDAHGFGILGKSGKGIIEQENLSVNDLPILVCPLGKAFGCYGAIVAGSVELIETLIQFSRSYIYTTAPPAALAMAAIKSLEIVQEESWRRDKLHHNIQYFQKKSKNMHLNFMSSASPIQSFLMKDPLKAVELSQLLEQKGFRVYPMRPPTVPHHTSRLRISLTAAHTEKQIDTLLETLARLINPEP